MGKALDMAAILWTTWLVRNDVYWSGKMWHVEEIKHYVQALVSSWHHAYSPISALSSNAMPVVQSGSSNIWCPPLVGFLKCNVDAALLDDIMGFGAVVRDHAGKFVALFTSPMTKKKGNAGPPSRRSLHLAEQARQEMLRQRKLAHGGHEVGDTFEDPLPIPSDEEKEETPPPLPGAKIGSPMNPDYDSDYVEFLTEFLADDSLGDTPPASPATPDTTFPSVPSTAFEADRPSPPSQTPSMVSTDSPTGSV
nr:uncharacterized protein LOC109154734 [Ipomoea trifida]